jgi:hypothetical protein
MTKRILLINVGFVCLGLAALLGFALKFNGFHDILKDYTSIFLAIAAAYLAYCFQKRQAFLASLRELWHKCIEAKAELIDYTHDAQPDRTKFGKAHRALSNFYRYGARCIPQHWRNRNVNWIISVRALA